MLVGAVVVEMPPHQKQCESIGLYTIDRVSAKWSKLGKKNITMLTLMNVRWE